MSLTKVTYSMIKGASVNVLDYGADPTGTVDSTSAIQAAINSGAPYDQYATDGLEVYFPAGKYKVSSIDFTACHGVHLVGAGIKATEIFTYTNQQVIYSNNSSSVPLSQAGIKDMTIRGGGKNGASNHGVDLQWSNSCILENLVFFGCNSAVLIAHAWQTVLKNIRVFGSGSDQSSYGLFMDASTLANIDNAVIADNFNVQDVAQHGFRIINGQGSKFSNCEAGNCGGHGWYIGDPSSGTVACQWIHVVNCLSDSNTLTNWYLFKGNATTMGEMIFTGIWTGNSGDRGFQVTNGTDIQINGLISITTPGPALDLDLCTRITASNISARQWNNSNNGYACVNLYSTTESLINGVEGYSTYGNYSVLESGSSNNNVCMDLAFHPYLTGASSCSFFKDTSGSLTVGSQKPFYVIGTTIIGTQITAGDGATLYVNQQQGSGNIGIETETDITTNAYQLVFRNPNGQVGAITTNGSATAYATSSDYRLKENVVSMFGALDKVMQLNPVNYTWKIDGKSGQGFIAHELQSVIPDCVTGEKDAVDKDGKPVYQGVDTSFLVATLTKAIQELKVEVDALKGK